MRQRCAIEPAQDLHLHVETARMMGQQIGKHLGRKVQPEQARAPAQDVAYGGFVVPRQVEQQPPLQPRAEILELDPQLRRPGRQRVEQANIAVAAAIDQAVENGFPVGAPGDPVEVVDREHLAAVVALERIRVQLGEIRPVVKLQTGAELARMMRGGIQ